MANDTRIKRNYKMNITLIISVGTFLFVVIGGGIAYGVVKQKVEESAKRNDAQDVTIEKLATKVELQALEIRLKEDRECNAKQHDELLASRLEHSNLIVASLENMKNLTQSIDELKENLKTGLKEVRDDIGRIKP